MCYVDLAGRKKQLFFFFVLFFGKTKRFCLCRDPFCNVVRHFKKIIYFTGTPETVEVAQRIASLPSVRLPAEVNYWTTKHSNHPLIQPVRVCVCVCVCVSCHSTRACFFLWPLSSFHCNLVSIMKTAACVSFTELLPPGYDERHRGRSEKNTQLQSTWQPKQHGSLHKKKKTSRSGRLKKSEPFYSTLTRDICVPVHTWRPWIMSSSLPCGQRGDMSATGKRPTNDTVMKQ